MNDTMKKDLRCAKEQKLVTYMDNEGVIIIGGKAYYLSQIPIPVKESPLSYLEKSASKKMDEVIKHWEEIAENHISDELYAENNKSRQHLWKKMEDLKVKPYTVPKEYVRHRAMLGCWDNNVYQMKLVYYIPKTIKCSIDWLYNGAHRLHIKELIMNDELLAKKAVSNSTPIIFELNPRFIDVIPIVFIPTANRMYSLKRYGTYHISGDGNICTGDIPHPKYWAQVESLLQHINTFSVYTGSIKDFLGNDVYIYDLLTPEMIIKYTIGEDTKWSTQK